MGLNVCLYFGKCNSAPLDVWDYTANGYAKDFFDFYHKHSDTKSTYDKHDDYVGDRPNNINELKALMIEHNCEFAEQYCELMDLLAAHPGSFIRFSW